MADDNYAIKTQWGDNTGRRKSLTPLEPEKNQTSIKNPLYDPSSVASAAGPVSSIATQLIGIIVGTTIFATAAVGLLVATSVLYTTQTPSATQADYLESCVAKGLYGIKTLVLSQSNV